MGNSEFQTKAQVRTMVHCKCNMIRLRPLRSNLQIPGFGVKHMRTRNSKDINANGVLRTGKTNLKICDSWLHQGVLR